MKRATAGDRVVVRADGTFDGYAGKVSHITQHARNARRFVWVVFDDHPWQQPGVAWAFTLQELRSEERERG